MTMLRRQHSGALKAQVVLEALRGERTLNELAAADGVHSLPIPPWKRVAWEELPKVLSNRRATQATDAEALKAALVPPDRPVESGVGLAEKNSGPSPLRRSGRWWKRAIHG
jgi:transposase-like protein